MRKGRFRSCLDNDQNCFRTDLFTPGSRIVDQNLRPLFLAVRCAVPQLLQAGSGAVIAIASMYGLVGQYERVAYCGAKFRSATWPMT